MLKYDLYGPRSITGIIGTEGKPADIQGKNVFMRSVLPNTVEALTAVEQSGGHHCGSLSPDCEMA